MSEDLTASGRPRRNTRQSLRANSTGVDATPSRNGTATPVNNPYKRPKYVAGRDVEMDEEDEVETPPKSGRGKRARGRASTAPATGSAASSTNGSRSRSRGNRGSVSGVTSSAKLNSRPECIVVRNNETPARGNGRPKKAPNATPKKKRGYNSQDFHYGSDFDGSDNESEPEQAMAPDSDNTSEQEESDEAESKIESADEAIESDSDNVSEALLKLLTLPSPPIPFWLDIENKIEELEVPESSDDLLLNRELIIKAVSIYEPLRRFHQLVRLTPFKFEDFCACLVSEEQSTLLAEIHIQLLKTIIREDEANGTIFGPSEYKDSVQTTLFFMDYLTWPESLRSYMESDSNWEGILNEYNSCEYPFVGPEIRIKVLSWLVDVFVMTNIVRETLISEGTILHEDHCRSCNRLGELICCETCPAVYHLTCIDPPVSEDDPPDDWKCPICVKHKLSGINDCTSDLEKAGLLIRHEKLGYDRHGRKYWFLVRRILIESEDGSEVWYYSTPLQIDELLSRLDPIKYEEELCKTILELKEEILSHMEITAKLTNTQNAPHRKTYLEAEIGCLKRMREEREMIKKSEEEEEKRKLEEEEEKRKLEEEEKRKLEEEEKRKLEQASQQGNEEEKSNIEEESQKKENERKRIREERLAKRNQNKFVDPLNDKELEAFLMDDSHDSSLDDIKKEESGEMQVDQDKVNDSNSTQDGNSTEIKEEAVGCKTVNEAETQLLEENSDTMLNVKEDKKEVESTTTCVKTEGKTSPLTTRSKTGSLTPSFKAIEASKSSENALVRKSKALALDFDSEERMTRLKAGGLFKLGQEGNFRSYVNYYATDPLALSKNQHAEERDRRRLMSHKFSLTHVSEYKWTGSQQGFRNVLVGSLRGTLLGIENNVPQTLLHVNWPLLRKAWVSAVTSCNSAKDFSKAIIAISACFRPAIFNNIWSEGIGHIKLQRISALEREEIKKVEKRDKKDRDDEEDRLRLLPQFVKYSIPPKHQIWKQKGEEYRLHARYGWIWMSTLRPNKPVDARKRGLLNGPYKHVIQVKNEVGKVKTMLIDPKVFEKLMAKRSLAKNTPAPLKPLDGENESSSLENQATSPESGVVADENMLKNEDEDKQVFDQSSIEPSTITHDEALLKEEKIICDEPEPMEVKLEDENEVEQNMMTTSNISKMDPIVMNPELPKDIFEDDEVNEPVKEDTIEGKEEINDEVRIKTEDEQSTKKDDSGDDKEDAIKTPSKTDECKKFKTDLINVSLGIVSANRILYPKIAHKIPFLDGLLSRREKLLQIEEKELLQAYGDTFTKIRNQTLKGDSSHKSRVEEEANAAVEPIKIDDKFPLGGIYVDYRCFSNSCQNDETASVKNFESKCYSPLCRLKFVITQNHRRKMEKIKKIEREQREKAIKEIREKIHFTQLSSDEKIYLKKPPDNYKKKRNHVKYPLTSGFRSYVSKKPSILIIPQYELKKLARSGGRHISPIGFTQNPKPVTSTWPYPSGRPLFKSAWQFRTVHSNTIASVALQLRTLYASIRWDDILVKPPANSEGKNTVTTDMEIITTEILNHRITGRFLEKVQYLRKKHVVPIDAPLTKTMPRVYSEITPVRSGLRKRKRAESPEKSDPIVKEEWVDEDKVEIWEIKYYGDRLERKSDKKVETPAITTKTGRTVNRPDKYDPSPSGISAAGKSAELIKEQLETEMKMQRAVHLSKRDNHVKSNNNNAVKTPAAPTASQQLQQQNAAAAAAAAAAQSLPPPPIANPRSYSVPSQVAGGKKFFITKQAGGQILVTNSQQQQPQPAPMTTAGNPVILNRKVPLSNNPNPNSALPPGTISLNQQQKIQVFRSSDGKLQIRGLYPGQHAYQTVDGKIHVVTQPQPIKPIISTPSTGNILPSAPLSIQQTAPTPTAITPKNTATASSASSLMTYSTPKNSRKSTITAVNMNVTPTPLPIGISQQTPTTMLTQTPAILTQTPTTLIQNPATTLTQTPTTTFTQPPTTPASISTPTSSGILQTNETLQPAAAQQPQQFILTQSPLVATGGGINLGGLSQLGGGQKIILNDGNKTYILNAGNLTPQQLTNLSQQFQGKKVLLQKPATSTATAGVQQQQIVSNQIIPQQHQQQQQTTTMQIIQQPGQPIQIIQTSQPQQQVMLASGQHITTTIGGQQVILKKVVKTTPQTSPFTPRLLQPSPKSSFIGNQKIINSAPTITSSLLAHSSPTIASITSSSSPLAQTRIESQKPPGKPAFPSKKTIIRMIPEQVKGASNLNLSSPTTTTTSQGLPISIVAPSPTSPKAKPISTQFAKIDSKTENNLTNFQAATSPTQNASQTQNDVANQQQSLQQGISTTGGEFDQQSQPNVSPVVKQQPSVSVDSPQQHSSKIYAQIVQSPQGPRVVIQGLNAANFTPEQMAVLKQQIKNQLIEKSAIAPTSNIISLDETPNRSPQVTKKQPKSPAKSKSPYKPKSPRKFSPLPSVSASIDAVVASESEENNGILKNILGKADGNGDGSKMGDDGDFFTEANGNDLIVSNELSISSTNNSKNSPVQQKEGSTKAILKALSETNFPKSNIIRTSPSNNNSIVTKTSPKAKNSPKKKRKSDGSTSPNMKYSGQKLVSTLFKHKEHLKNDILKKRELLEKDLHIQIQKEISDELSKKSPKKSSKSDKTPSPKKRKSSESTSKSSPKSKKQKKSNNPAEEKLYCICKKPYDKSRFYVGCDVCSNWFHGECIDITEEMSKDLADYICDACRENRDNRDKLYCLCKQPYDESQFYICCDTCQDWFHGRCVGILPSEAANIDIYYCPNCEPNSEINHANLRPLDFNDYPHLVKLLKQIQTHRCSWPFLEPVDAGEAPNYYRVIKQPMDLQTVELRVEEKCYSRLRDFIGDITKIFENCRYYNPAESPFYKSAETLESFFAQKISLLRQKLT